LQRFKVLLRPKYMRMLALGFVLLASLLFWVQSRYGPVHNVVVGNIRRGEQAGIAVVDVMAAWQAGPKEVEVKASGLLLGSIDRAGENACFLAVIVRRGDELVFERLRLVASPPAADLPGPRHMSGILRLVVGKRPELVEMIGLDRYGYRVVPPAWAKEKMPGADMVYQQQGTWDAAKDVLDGNRDYSPDLYVLDSKERVVGMGTLGRSLLTLPEFLRRCALGFAAAAVLAAAASQIIHNRAALARLGRRIRDQVSMRWLRLFKRG